MKNRHTAPITWHRNPELTPEQVADRAVEIIKEGVELSGSEWQQDFEADPKGLYEELVELATNALHGELAASMQCDPVTIYRTINGREDAIRWDQLGIYWAYDESYAEPFWYKAAVEDENEVTLRATVASKNVDWLTSIALHMLHAEGELRLRKNAPIHVEAININDIGWHTRHVQAYA